MTAEVDDLARDAIAYAHHFGDKMQLARIKDLPDAERMAAEAKAFLNLTLLGEKIVELKRLMPESFAEGRAMRADLREIS